MKTSINDIASRISFRQPKYQRSLTDDVSEKLIRLEVFKLLCKGDDSSKNKQFHAHNINLEY